MNQNNKNTPKLDHIGIAVKHLADLKKLFELMGLIETSTEAVPEQGVITHFLPVSKDSNTKLELLEVTDPQGTVAKFIEKKGPGIHHLSFLYEQGELEPLMEKLGRAGFRLIYDSPKKGAHGMRVNFIHPMSAGGILIEIMEKAPF